MDIAELGIKIDSGGATAAVSALDKLTGAAGTAEKATTSLGGAAEKTSASVTKLSKTGADAGLKKVDTAAKQTTATILGLGAGAQSMTATWAALAAQNSRTATATQAAGAAMTAVEVNTRALAAEMVQAQQEAAAYAAEMDAVRARYNPLFAASKQYEVALQEIAAAERMGAISTREAAAARDAAAAGLVRVSGAAESVAKGSILASHGARMMGMQLSQVGQQTMASGNFIQALAIQLPDIGLGFGAVGMAAGLLAGIALPLVANAFSSAEEEVKTFDDRLGDLKSSTEALKGTQDILTMSVVDLYEKYGIYALSIRSTATALAELQVAQAKADLATAVNEAADALGRYAGAANSAFSSGTTAAQGLVNIRDELGLTGQEAFKLQDAFEQMQDATGARQQEMALQNLAAVMREAGVSAEKLPEELREALTRANEAAIAAGELRAQAQSAADAAAAIAENAPGGGWLADAIADAGTLAGALWDAAAAAAAAKGDGAGVDARGEPTQYGEGSRARSRPRRAPVEGAIVATGKAAGRGGGGGKQDDYKADLDALVTSLQTERETLDAWYEESQKILADRRAIELLGEEEHKAAKLALEQDYQAQLREIQDSGYEMERQARNAALSEAESLLNIFAGKSRAAAIAAIALNKGLRIAEIIQNTAAASMRAIAELGPIAGPPMAAKIAMWGKIQAGIVAATGLAQAAGAGGGGSFGGGSTPAAQGAASGEAAAPTGRLVVQGIKLTDIFTGQMLMDMLGEELQARGVEFIR